MTPTTARSCHRSEIGLDDLGIGLDRLRRAFGDLGAEVEHHDAVGQIHHKSHVLLHQQHRHAAAAQLAQQAFEPLLLHMPQSRAPLGAQQTGRACAQRAGASVGTLLIRLKVVVLPAPFGPISATISRAWTSKETLLTAITPPNCLRALSICSSTLAAVAALGRGGNVRDVSGRLRFGLRGNRATSQGQTPVGASCSNTTSRMPNTMVSSWPSP